MNNLQLPTLKKNAIAAFVLGLLFMLAFSPLNVSAFQADTTETNIEIFAPPNVPTPNQYHASNGAPGPKYWQNEVDYKISATLNPETKMLSGSETITYTNNSPQKLEFLWLQLDQNIFKPTSTGARITGSAARWSGSFKKGGYKISNVQLVRDGETIQADYYIEGTEMRIALQEPLSDKDGTLKIKLDFSFKIPQYGADRMGRLDVEQGTVFELAQWYPRMFVFDASNGWNTMPYLGQGEFYLEYGSFDVAITVPRNMIIAATGTLQNPEKVLTEEQREALEEARESKETVTIIGKEEVGDASTRPDGEGMLTWHYHAENVRDFTWAASSAFIWDAARINTHDGEPALAQSFYPKESIGEGDTVGWEQSTQMVQHSIEFYSEFVAPYPYPVAINVAGVVGGMEYPMIVFCSWKATGRGLFGVTDHEFGHEWYPMIVGSDERRHVWMDEGLNTFMNYYSGLAYYNQDKHKYFKRVSAAMSQSLKKHAPDQPIMTYTDRIPAEDWGFLGYSKPGFGLVLLREYILGPKVFDSAFKEYFERWKYKHPQPADFFRTMEEVSGQNLDWFWNGWFYTSSKLNPALQKVSVKNDTTTIVVEQRGKMIMPLEISVTFDDGSTQKLNIPEEAFYFSDKYTLVLGQPAKRVTLGPDNILPDVSREDGLWTAKEGLQTAPPFTKVIKN